jgi:cupredoxin-like protein
MMGSARMALAGTAVGFALALSVAPSWAEDAESYTLTIRQHRFEPTEIEIPAGKKISLVVKNLDATPEEFESIELHREKVVSGGSEITVYIGPLKPGRYEFFGDFNPDTARGHIIAK